MKAYAITGDYSVYGNEVKFESLGSLAPVIAGFNPERARWEDTVKISGKHFSYVPSQNIVRFGDTKCDRIISASDTLIKVLVRVTLANPIVLYPLKLPEIRQLIRPDISV